MAAASGRTSRPVVPVLSLLLLLLLLGGQRGARGDCSRCRCEETYTECEDAELKKLPAGLPNTTESLFIRFSPIRKLTSALVAEMGSAPFLSYMSMSDGSLEAVGTAALRPLTNLTFIDLSRNRLWELAPDAFPLSLGTLVLSDNRLQLPVDGRFLDAPSLEYLYLDNCSITELPPGTLQLFPQLQYLDLSDNLLTSLHPDTFAQNSEINILKLEGNPLQAPADGPLLRAQSLEMLVLSSTGLSRPTTDLFRGLVNLDHLDLKANGIQTLPRDFFSVLPNISSLTLVDNPLGRLPEALMEPPASLNLLDLQNTSLGPSLPIPLLRSETLQVLDLSSNGLEELPAAALEELPHLEYLYLNDNRGLRFDARALQKALPKLRMLWASNTASACPCLERELWGWAKKKEFASGIECDGHQSERCPLY